MKRWAWVLLLLMPVSFGFSVVLVDRGTRYTPFQMEPDAQSGLFCSAWGWGEFGRYFARTDQERYWDARLGAYAEFFRLGGRYSLVINSDIELVACSNNDIRFQPRAFFWHESLMFYMKLAGSTVGAGYYHRCKHDTDNLNLLLTDGVEYARVLIWDSLTLSWTSDPVEIKLGERLGFKWMPFADNHFYVIRQDGISVYYGDRYPTYTNLVDTVSAGFRVEVPSAGLVRWYFQPQMTLDVYHSEGRTLATADWFVETGFGVRGRAFDADLYVRFESFYDGGIEPFRLPGKYWIAGIKLN